MSMFPPIAERGSFMPRQKSFTPVDRTKRSFKDYLPKRASFSRRDSKTRNSRTGSFTLERSFSIYDPLTDPPVDGDPSDQRQSLFFSRLPFEIRLQIYEEVIGSKEIYHFRTLRGLCFFRCPRARVSLRNQKLQIMECENGHPWARRPYNLLQAREQHSYHTDTKPAILSTCRRAYLEAFDSLYKRSNFCFSGPEPLLAFCRDKLTIRSNAGLERIHTLELRAPDLLAWKLRLEQPKQNMSGITEWKNALLALKQMRSLRSLYVIIPNYGIRKRHSVEIERSLLGHFLDLPTITTFIVWIAWYDDEGRGYPKGDAEAGRYPFDIVRFDDNLLWPDPFSDEDKTGDSVAAWVDSERL